MTEVARVHNYLNQIARCPGESVGGRARRIAAAVPKLAGMALPPHASAKVAAMWGQSPPIAVIHAVISTTVKIASWAGVLTTPEQSEPSSGPLRSSNRPKHSPSVRFHSLETRVINQEGKDAETCAICQIEFSDGDMGFVFKQCQHPFHVKCLNRWLERGDSCPTCRGKLCAPHQHGVQQQEARSLEQERRRLELETLETIMNEHEDQLLLLRLSEPSQVGAASDDTDPSHQCTAEHILKFRTVMRKRRVIWKSYAEGFEAAVECHNTPQAQAFAAKFLPFAMPYFCGEGDEGGSAFDDWCGKDRRKHMHPAPDQTAHFRSALLCAVQFVLHSLARGETTFVRTLDLVLDETSPIYSFQRAENVEAHAAATQLLRDCQALWVEGHGPVLKAALLEGSG
eukprot:CAMPEP_0181291904 /NCGR_PEP_ID=MMETSP1101-20121128/2218_1 /TAXON_ID=46948 /ORGANISM="Rhodomonas abbreviata, Strain Caron Lab Isolate" /LENGTH=397 /DNA_ID=CAMNT_0023396331 /DNA_START=36 /DNA_END=1226 /DNA_ORIENTATION=-